MEIKNILITICIVILLYIVIRYITTDVNTLSGLQAATTMQTVSAKSLAKGSSGANTSNFTYSIWFYINDWNYRYGESKIVYGRMSSPSTTAGASSESSSSSIPGIPGVDPCPAVVLTPIQNNVSIYLACFPGGDAGGATGATASDDTPGPSGSVIHTCSVSNVPIQKWVNLLISAYGRTLDVYIDGKLVRTCLLPGIAKINPNSNVYVTPSGGFDGWTSKFQYFPNSTDPQTAWNIYQAGYGQSFLSNLFGKYKIQLNVLEGTTENTVFTI